MTNPSQIDQDRTKDGRKISDLVRGCVLLLFGAWMAAGCIRAILYILSTQSFRSWFAADTALRIAAAVFFIWIGIRAIRRFGQEVPPTKIGWGRLLLGIVLIYIQVRDHFIPNPNALQPDNADQAFGMQAMSAIFLVVGLALVFWAFLKKRPQHTLPAEESSASAAK